MKKLLLLLFSMVFLSPVVDGQEAGKADSNESKISMPVGKSPHQDMLLVDLNWDYLLNLNAPAQQKWYGRGIAASLVYDHPLRKDGRVSVAAGGGICNHNYYTDALLTKIDSTNQIYFRVVGDTLKKRGKLSVNYVDVPVELRFRLPNDRRGECWKFAIGARAGYRINVHEKVIDGNDFKYKTYYYPQVGLFRYGAVARVGYGAIMMSAFYSLSPLFDQGVGLTRMSAFSLGLTITPF